MSPPPVFKSVAVGAPWQTAEKGGLFPGTVTDYRAVEPEKLAGNIDIVCHNLHAEGYRILSITPLTAGYSDTSRSYGYSRTTGVVITGTRQ